eukprot:gene12489-3172_t
MIHLARGQGRKLAEDGLNNVREFVRSVIYSGKDDEDYVETRIPLYKSLKNKSSMSLPPDPDSVVQVIKRAHCQAYVWYRCGQRTINHLDLEEFGWKIQDGDVKPVWFVGNQFPPSVKSIRGRRAKGGSFGEYDSCNSEKCPPRKKARKQVQKWRRRKRKGLDDLPPNKQTISDEAEDSPMAETAIINSGEEGDKESDTNDCVARDSSRPDFMRENVPSRRDGAFAEISSPR